jgi:hypothetical protein
MIGYIRHGSGPLSPPEALAECRICECAAYSYATLEDGLCDICVEEYVCIECGEEMGEDQETDKYGYCPECKNENS